MKQGLQEQARAEKQELNSLITSGCERQGRDGAPMSALPVRVLEAGAQASAATSSMAINLILKLNPDTPSPTSSPGAAALHVIKAPPTLGMKKAASGSHSGVRDRGRRAGLAGKGTSEAHSGDKGCAPFAPPASPHKMHTQLSQL